MERVDRPDRRGQDLGGQGLLGPEGGGERPAEAGQEGRPGRALLVADVGVGDHRQARQHAARRARRREPGVRDERLARGGGEEAVAVGVAEGALAGVAPRRASGGAGIVAAGGQEEEGNGGEEERGREARRGRARRRRGGEGARAPHSAPSPATTGSRPARAAAQAAAAAASAARPARTSAAWRQPTPSGSVK
jgi:hypothetical protein